VNSCVATVLNQRHKQMNDWKLHVLLYPTLLMSLWGFYGLLKDVCSNVDTYSPRVACRGDSRSPSWVVLRVMERWPVWLFWLEDLLMGICVIPDMCRLFTIQILLQVRRKIWTLEAISKAVMAVGEPANGSENQFNYNQSNWLNHWLFYVFSWQT